MTKFWPFLTGVAFGATMVFPQFWFLGLAALAGGVMSAERAISLRRALLAGYFFGLGFCSVSLSFLLLAYPTDWLGLPQKLSGALIVLGVWLLCTLPVPLAILPWSVGVYFSRNRPFLARVLLGAGLWVFCEYLRSSFSTLILWKPGMLLGPHIGFTLTGLSISGSDGLMWFAYVGGFWTLAFVAYLFAGLLAESWFRWQMGERKAACRIFASVLCACLLAIAVPPALTVELGVSSVPVSEETTVALVHTNFPRSGPPSRETRVHGLEMVDTSIRDAVLGLDAGDLIILPEDSRYFDAPAYLSEEEVSYTQAALDTVGVTLIDSGRVPDWDGVYSVVQIDTPGTSTTLEIRKTLLAAFGEYMPSVFSGILDLAGFHAGLEEYESLRGYEPSGGAFVPQEHTFKIGDTIFGILACSEVLSTQLYPLLGEESDVLLNISSLSAGNGSPIMFNQFLAMAKIHAVAARKPYLQATNFEPNILITPQLSSTQKTLGNP